MTLAVRIGTLIFAVITGVLAVPLLVMWVFGIPGAPSPEVAAAWEGGLVALTVYIVGDALLLTLYAIFGLLSRWVRELDPVFSVLIFGFWVLFGYTLVRLWPAISLLLG
jgi:hypothetical protein